MTPVLLSHYFSRLQSLSGYRWQGKVTQVVGQVVESEGPFGSAGDACEIQPSNGKTISGQIIGFRNSTALVMTCEPPGHVRYGDRVISWGAAPPCLLGC